MIEVIHFKNRWGRQVVAVIHTQHDYETIQNKAYADRYTAGLEPAFYPVPAIIFDVTLRPMGLCVWRCWDGIEGDRFTQEHVWWNTNYKIN